MTRTEWLADRMDLLREIDAIERDLKHVVQRHGDGADAEDIRRRLHQARGVVSAQVADLLCRGDAGVMH